MVTTNENVCRNLKYVCIKFAQVDLQKCITWPKKIEKPKETKNPSENNIVNFAYFKHFFSFKTFFLLCKIEN
jgi:hypothetical protein